MLSTVRRNNNNNSNNNNNTKSNNTQRKNFFKGVKEKNLKKLKSHFLGGKVEKFFVSKIEL